VYFFGGPDGAAEAAARRINAESAGMRCVGYQCPGFGSVEEMSGADRIDRINASGADFLVVALGARKGQAWIERNRSRLQTPIISHLGAVVNFAAGTVSRAPRWMQRSGLEWLWRIKEEPALWRRYWNDGKALLYLLATRVVPFALRQRRESLAGGEAAGVRVQVSHGPGRTEVRLGGACTRGNLSGIREVFRYATEGCGDILLDLGEVSHVDSGFVALVMLLAGDRSGKSARLEVAGARPPVRAVFAGLNAGFLLGPSAS
jgi:N-acetylglucosaminyldiphosphoundecaprenol N-acetyl-beta-D-mannosaminyltransferase